MKPALAKIFCLTSLSLCSAANDSGVAIDLAEGRSEIVFVDSAVEQASVLIDGVRAGVEVFTLVPDSDGLAQIVEALSSRKEIDAVHILSHGKSGGLMLGDAIITSDDLEIRGSEFAEIGKSITEGGDLIFYGCDIANGSRGDRFIETIAEYTRADIAASIDATGIADLGGDWELERGVGSIEAEIAFGDAARSAFNHQVLGFSQGQFLSGNANTNNYGSTLVGPGGTIYGAWGYAAFPDSGNVRFATWNGSNWTEIPGSALTGTIISSQLTGLNLINQLGTDAMKVDGNGDIHVALSVTGAGSSPEPRGVVYGFFDVSAQTWSFRRIFFIDNSSRTMFNGGQILLLDSTGNPHIVFGWDDGVNNTERIEYAFFDGMSWSTTGNTNDLTVANIDALAGGPNIIGIDAAIDGSNNIHLSYVREDADQISGDIWYAVKTGATWGSPTEIADLNDRLGGTSIALDSSGDVHIAYAQETATNQFTFRILSNTGGSFAVEDAGTVSVPGADFFSIPGRVQIAINGTGQRLLSGEYGAFDPMFNRIEEDVVVSSETSPGTWVVETAYNGSSAGGNLYTTGALCLADDNTAVVLQGVRNDDFTTGNLQFAVGVPDALAPPSLPVIGVSQTVSVSGSQATFDLYLENLGPAVIESLALPLDLDAVFGSGNYGLASGPTLIDDPGTISLNGSYNGSGATGVIAAGSTLGVGDTAQIQIVVDVDRLVDGGSGLGDYSSQVTASGQSSDGDMTSDTSDSGTDPDPNGNGDPDEAGENDPTPFTIAQQPVIGVSLTANVFSSLVDTVDFDIYVENLGNVPLQEVQVRFDLDSVFGAGNYGVHTVELVVDPGTVQLEGDFGRDDEERLLVGGSSTLEVGGTARIQVGVSVFRLADRGSGFGVYESWATASGDAPGGSQTNDTSDNGTDPDPDGDGNPDEAGENDPTPVVIPQRPVIGIAVSSAVDTREVTFDLYLESFGNVGLEEVSLPFDLDSMFGAGNYTILTGPSLVDDPGTFSLNGGFDGSGSNDLLVPGSSSLALEDTAQIRLVVEVSNPSDQGFGIGVYSSQITAFAQSPDMTPTSDLSDSGTDPDPDGDGNPSEPGEDDMDSVELMGTMGGLVWDDLDGDGVRDSGEPGLPGVTIYLDLNRNGVLDTGEPSLATSAAGDYDFQNVAMGEYAVAIDETTLPGGYFLTGGSLPTIVVLFAGEDADNVDFGFIQSNYRPDLRYGDAKNPASHRGDNTYGGRQRANTKTRKSAARVYFSLENDGNTLDTISTKIGGISKREFKVKISELRKGNVTGGFRREGVMRELEPGEIINFRASIKVKRRGQSGNFRAWVLSRSQEDELMKDLNQFKIQFLGRRISISPKPSGF